MLTEVGWWSVAATLVWFGILMLPWKPWRAGPVFQPSARTLSELSELTEAVTVVIPARNEAELIGPTLASLANQDAVPKVLLIDDHSDDGTAERAREIRGIELRIIRSAPLPSGWSGKLWALEQGIQQVDTTYTLLLDADIRLAPGALGGLVRQLRECGAQLVSVMASLRMESFWEKLLMPAFIYFFKLLYPFQLANSPDSRFAAAAGGCVLIETRVLRQLGGLSAIKGDLIDDCALARAAKRAGYRIWIGVSRAVVSHRRYESLQPIWEMVARTAYTQLRYSPVNLLACTFLMGTLYWSPVIAWASAGAGDALLASCTYGLMMLSYLPTLKFYERHLGWALAKPLIATLYLAMTWSSAIRYWRGERSRWKGRIYR